MPKSATSLRDRRQTATGIDHMIALIWNNGTDHKVSLADRVSRLHLNIGR
jgi:hypothetical protein